MTLRGPCRVILIGMMGSGKSTVGRELAQRTGWPHHDNDDLLLRLTGMTPRQLLASWGERRLRSAESQAMAVGLGSDPPCIVGAAAGTILAAADRSRMAEAGVVVWLRVSAATIDRRASGAAHRAWLDRPGWVASALAERDPLYASVADVVIDADTLDTTEIAQAVVERIGRLKACTQWLPPTA